MEIVLEQWIDVIVSNEHLLDTLEDSPTDEYMLDEVVIERLIRRYYEGERSQSLYDKLVANTKITT